MELRQLKYFLAVADARSFVSAANSLYLSRQAVSKAISQLEAELHVELFMRDSGGAFLTPVGVMFYERVRNSVLELEQLTSEIKQYGSQFRQVIRVAFSIGTLPLFEHKIQEYIQKQTNLVVKYFECTPNECETVLKEHKADLVITSKVISDPNYQSRVLFESPYGVLLKNQDDLEWIKSITPKDLDWLPLGCFADGQSGTFCRSFGQTPMYSAVDLLRLFSIAADGQCAALLPECLHLLQSSDLRWFPLDVETKWQVFSVYLKSMENNTLYHSTIDTFLMQVFDLPSI